MKRPLVSVVMPAYNAEKYIAEAIKSILAQSFKNFELLIVDDSSTDDTWKVAKLYEAIDRRIVLLSNTRNLKSSRTMNRAFKLCKGRYIAVMDNDDYSYPNRIKKQFNFMEKHKKIGALGGTIKIVKENCSYIGMRKYYQKDSEIRKHIFRFSPIAHPSVMFRKSVLDKVGYYNPKYAPADDYELYFRIGAISEFGNLPEVLLTYRARTSSITNVSTKLMQLNTIKVRRLYDGKSGYRMNATDKIITVVQCFAIYLMPRKILLWAFNKLRNSK